MELGSLLGVIFAIVAIVMGILISIEWQMDRLILYIDAASVMIVFVGSFASTLWATPIGRVLAGFKAIGKTFKPPVLDAKTAIDNIIALSNLARRESILAMEEPVKAMNDPFLMKGIMLVVDGADPELVRNVMETEISYTESRHANVRGFWEFWAGSAPAWGMMGTLIGLINMLAQLDDVAALGANMAMVIITTFYGAVVANAVANPVANKLKIFSSDEMLVKEVLIEGILSIQAGDNPRYIEEKLKAFLAPAIRDNKPEETGE